MGESLESRPGLWATLASIEGGRVRRRIVQHTYEAPNIWTLGTVRELTLMPGKSGPSHDGSSFQANISCDDARGDCPPSS